MPGFDPLATISDEPTSYVPGPGGQVALPRTELRFRVPTAVLLKVTAKPPEPGEKALGKKSITKFVFQTGNSARYHHTSLSTGGQRWKPSDHTLVLPL